MSDRLRDKSASLSGSPYASKAIPHSGTTLAAGYDATQAFLTPLTDNTTAFTVALAANGTQNLDLSAAGANTPNVSFGATSAASYSGTLTPYGNAYKLGGGANLTVTGPLTNGPSAEVRTLSVTGAGAVILNPTVGNTFTGDTTVAAGTLQIDSALAFNNIARNVIVNAAGTAKFNANNAAQGATVAVNTGGTANFSAANAANGGLVNVNNSGTATFTATNAGSGGTFEVNSGGINATPWQARQRLACWPGPCWAQPPSRATGVLNHDCQRFVRADLSRL